MSAATNPDLVDLEVSAAARIAELERKLAAVTEHRDRLLGWSLDRNKTIQNQRRALRDLQKVLLVERGSRHDRRVSDLERRVAALETMLAEGSARP